MFNRTSRKPTLSTTILFLSIASLLIKNPVLAAAVAQQFSFSGSLLDSANNPVVGNKPIILQIYNPNNDCLLYEEIKTVTLDSNGKFSTSVGTALGSALRSANDPGLSMATVFKNAGTILVPTQSCPGGYNPASGDSRKLRVIIDSEVLSPDYVLASVPSALVAESFSDGTTPQNLIKVNTTTASLNQANLENIFSTPNLSVLQNLIAGTSSLYAKSSSSNGTLLPPYAGAPATPVAGSIWYDSTSNNIKFHNGSTTQTLSSGGVTSVAGRTGAVTLTSSDLSDFGTAVDSRVPSSISSVKGIANGIASLDGTGKVPSTQLPPPSFASQSARSVFAAPTGGAGIPSFRALNINDIVSTVSGNFLNSTPACGVGRALTYIAANDQIECANVSQWTTNATNIYFTGGNVGIGTPTPVYSLHVNQGNLGVQRDLFNNYEKTVEFTTSLQPTGANFDYGGMDSWVSNSASQPVYSAYAIRGFIQNNSTATLNNAWGVLGQFQANSTGTVSSAAGIVGSIDALPGKNGIVEGKAGMFNVGGSGSIGTAVGVDVSIYNSAVTNSYGIRIGNLSGTNKYAIHSSSSAPSFLGGDLTVAGTITSSGAWSSPTSNLNLLGGRSYVANSTGTRLIGTLPSTCAIGSQIKIVGLGSGGWSLQAPGADKIRLRDGTEIPALDSFSPSDMAEVTCIANSPNKWAVTNASTPNLFGCQPGKRVYNTLVVDNIFEVPPGCFKIHVKAWGAGGGGSTSAPGGFGGYVGGVLNVNAGEQLRVRVGLGGGNGTAGMGGAGGGYTSIQRDADNAWFLIAGGGGGAGSSTSTGSSGESTATTPCSTCAGSGGAMNSSGLGGSQWSDGTYFTSDTGISAATPPSTPMNSADPDRIQSGEGGPISGSAPYGLLILEWGK